MNTIHSCGYHCDKPGCIKAQRDDLVKKFIVNARKPLTDELIDVLARAMVKGDKSVNWLCRVIEAEHGIGGEE